jgi:hypothetical protein
MLKFNDLTLPIRIEPIIVEKPSKGRYVIGFDPFDTIKDNNVVLIYDKAVMRVTTRVITNQPFEEWVATYTSKMTDVEKKMYKISDKFVKHGRCKTPAEIREENKVGDFGFKVDTTALESQ